MRSTRLISLAPGLALALATSCGGGGGSSTDGGGDTGRAPDAAVDAPPGPPVIAGGGVGGGPIDGVVNVYAIDDATRAPIAGATVTIGTSSGTTDAHGLFVATGLSGKQTVLVTAAAYRSEMWVGVNGTNLTFDLHPATQDASAVPQAILTGSVDLTSFHAQHEFGVAVVYSRDDAASDIANNLDNGQGECLTGSGVSSCHYSLVTRTGHVAIAAAIDDFTLSPPKVTLLGWALRTGIVVADGVAQDNQDLTPVPSVQELTETVDFGTPPAGLTQRAGEIAVELGQDGTLPLPFPVTPAAPSLLVPDLSVFSGGATYRFTGVAAAAGSGDEPESAVLVRAQTGQTLTAGEWLAPATGLSFTRTHAAWTSVPDATVQTAVFHAGSASPLNVTSFDGSTAFDIPAAAGLPATGTLTADVQALLAPGLDLQSFSLDADRVKVVGESSAPTQVN